MSADALSLQLPALPAPVKLYLHDEQDQVISQRLRDTGVWEPYETELLFQCLQLGDVFIDAGANIGYFSVLAAAAVGPQGRVFAFEPEPNNCALLSRSVAANSFEKQVTVVQAALAAQAGEARLHLHPSNLGDHQIYAGDGERDSISVQTLCGSDYLAPRANSAALLKVDTQGAEYQVMLGLMAWLQSLASPPRILLELTPYSLQLAGSSGRELIDLLASLGQPFWIVDHIEHCLHASDAPALATWCDNVAACEGDRGFMNILVGPAP